MRIRPFVNWLILAACLTAIATAAEDPPKPEALAPGSVKFRMHRIGTFRSEACGVGDFDNDGRLDVVAGPYLYLAPDWKPQTIRTLQGSVDEQGDGYYHDFMNLPLDVDGDGRLDVLSCKWHEKQSDWYRNTGPGGGQWPEAIIEKNGNFECGDLWDIDGDGKAQEVLPHCQATVWYELGETSDGKRGLLKHVVSAKPMDYGGGVGDVNGDGRPDIIRPQGWYEAPADPRAGTWKEHPLAIGNREEGKPEHTPQICVYDVNDDGLGDIVTSSGHAYGIFWYEQLRGEGEPRFKQHVIDASWTQAHSITLADLDHDGDLDLVTGKRFRAHNGGDPEGDAPPGVYWYELKRGPKPTWTKHVISYDRGIGSGMNVPVVDLDGDGDLDLVVTGKWGGPVWFENTAITADRGAEGAAEKLPVVLEEFDGVHANGQWQIHQYPGTFEYEVKPDELRMVDRGGMNQHLTRRGLQVDPQGRYALEALFTIQEAAGAPAPNSFCLNFHIGGPEDSLESLSCWSINVDVFPRGSAKGVMKYMGFVEGRFREIGQRLLDWCQTETEYLLRVEVNTDLAGKLKFKTLTVTVLEGDVQRERFEVDYSPFPYQPDSSEPVRIGANTHGADWSLRNLKVSAEVPPILQ